MASIDEQFIEFIVKSLVNNPDEVSIERSIDEKGVLLELTVDPEDLGRVIGKRGATAQSMRTLLRALGTKNDARYNLKIVDNGEPRPSRDEDKSEPEEEAEQTEPEKKADAKEESGEKKDDEKTAEKKNFEDEAESLAERTRKELADLDDLDV